jgi:hypothetical protein
MAGDPRRHGRRAVLWGLLFFAAAQFGMAVVIDRWRAVWSDPEYGYRLIRLRRRLAEAPHQPPVLVFGSSRVSHGFAADYLPPPGSPEYASPVVFNMSQSGATTFMELLLLKRVLALGIRPRYVILEVFEACLHTDDSWLDGQGVDSRLPPYRLRFSDLGVLRRYRPDVAPAYYRAWLEWNLVPWHSNRYHLLERYAPELLEPSQLETLRLGDWRHSLTANGWQPIPPLPDEVKRKALEAARNGYQPIFANFHLSHRVGGLLRDMLDTCRREGVPVLGLLLMPESSEFRGWRSPAVEAQIQTYLTGLCREYGIDLIDASAWVEDGEFFDGHHLLEGGARRFTERLWHEVLRPRLEAEHASGSLAFGRATFAAPGSR